MREVLSGLDELTPEWLTQALRSGGRPESARVSAVQVVTSRLTPAAVVAQLHVDYTPELSGALPSRLFLKMSRPDTASAAPARGRKEVKFYHGIAIAMSDPPGPLCFDATYSARTRRFHLLLQDLTVTHRALSPSLVQMESACVDAIDRLATIHARWWDRGLTEQIGGRPTAASVQHFFSWVERTLPAFLSAAGDRLRPEWRAIYDEVPRLRPPYERRMLSDRGLTFLHGDAHIGNFLFPRDPRADTIRIVDWESWFVGFGALDIAYLVVLYLLPERRAQLEEALLRHYHSKLLAQGVEQYDWDACWHDYRLAAFRNIFVPVSQWAAQLPAPLWLDNLERVLLAFEALRCKELA